MTTKRLPVAAVVLTLLAGSVLGLSQSQDPPKRRAPRLTTDDVVANRSGGKTAVVSESGPKPTSPESAARTTSRFAPPTAIKEVQGSIDWEGDLSSAIAKAGPERKLIVIDVYADWCIWCKRMDANIYADPKVVGLSREEVFLKMDAEDGGEGTRFADQMGVTGYPTTIILDERGTPLTRMAGYPGTVQAFINFVQKARSMRSR